MDNKTLEDKYKSENIGIIAGGGLLPLEVAQAYQKQCYGECFIAALEGAAMENAFKAFNYKTFPIASVGKILSYFKEHDVKNIVLVGNIKRPNISELKPDLAGTKIIAKMLIQKIRGDDHILRIILDYIQNHGFNVISPQEILFLGQNPEDVCTQNKPSKQNKNDIEIGISILKSLDQHDVGQSVIVCGGYVLGIEAAEGTDNLIIRCGDLRGNKTGGVLVKLSKCCQDYRLDLPTIGIDTIKNLSLHGFDGVYIGKKNVLISQLSEIKNIAEKSNIFICNEV